MVISNGDLIDDEVEGRLSSMLINSEVKSALRHLSHQGVANCFLIWTQFARTVELIGISSDGFYTMLVSSVT